MVFSAAPGERDRANRQYRQNVTITERYKSHAPVSRPEQTRLRSIYVKFCEVQWSTSGGCYQRLAKLLENTVEIL